MCGLRAFALAGRWIEPIWLLTFDNFWTSAAAGVSIEGVWMGAVGSLWWAFTSASVWVEPLWLWTS